MSYPPKDTKRCAATKVLIRQNLNDTEKISMAAGIRMTPIARELFECLSEEQRPNGQGGPYLDRVWQESSIVWVCW